MKNGIKARQKPRFTAGKEIMARELSRVASVASPNADPLRIASEGSPDADRLRAVD